MLEIKRSPQRKMKDICQFIVIKRRQGAISENDYKRIVRALELIQERFEADIDAVWVNYLCERGERDKLTDIIESQIAEMRKFLEDKNAKANKEV